LAGCSFFGTIATRLELVSRTSSFETHGKRVSESKMQGKHHAQQASRPSTAKA
jgi:hypothetical protein